jgi:hypothetical protein
MLLAPQAAGDTALTLRSALGSSATTLAIQAGAVITVAAIALRSRRTQLAWPVVISAVLGSFLIATYWHPQDYLVLDAAAAIWLAASQNRSGVAVAMAVAILSALAAPFTSHEMTLAWLQFSIVLLGLIGVSTFTHRNRTLVHA